MSARNDSLPANGGQHCNRLIHEQSPYLLQHARNPVDWYPWGEEAFAEARRQDKPIFLSIGYSTCHWCHVMERESFENLDLARLLNASFVPIKVDREERPDIDAVYMAYVQATVAGGGGWPMNVWLTPALLPFYGGTYFPPEDCWNQPGLKTVLGQIAEAWRTDRARLVTASEEILRQLQQRVVLAGAGQAAPLPALLDQACRTLAAAYDARDGGFGGPPKFPRPATLHFLLRYHAAQPQTQLGQQALDMTAHTLRKMAAGGVHDVIGGGFHRYAVDAVWHVPHFEKMLYDQAQLACAYLDAYQLTREAGYADTARDILAYVGRDLRGAAGQFFSAEDADSPQRDNLDERAEGAFYTWELAEIAQSLGADTHVFNYYYDVQQHGNVLQDPHGDFRNRNILIARHTVAETAAARGRTPAEVEALLSQARATLLAIRAQRLRPQRDDKTITAWNGLMISAFARAAQVLDDTRCRQAAEDAAHFIAAHLYQPATGTLLRRYREGQAAIAGYADDYACLIQGLLDLYEATLDGAWLTWAVALQHRQTALFWDAANGGFFSTAGQDASIVLRVKEAYDGAEPCPNSVSSLNLLRLAQLLEDDAFGRQAQTLLAAFSPRLAQAPDALPQMLSATLFDLASPVQIILAGDPAADDTRALLRVIHARFIPNKTLLLATGGGVPDVLLAQRPALREMGLRNGRATAYVCRGAVCKPPATDAATLAALLADENPGAAAARQAAIWMNGAKTENRRSA